MRKNLLSFLVLSGLIVLAHPVGVLAGCDGQYCDGTFVFGIPTGQTICGMGLTRATCRADGGWDFGPPCAVCGCEGTSCDGKPVTGTNGQTICGLGWGTYPYEPFRCRMDGLWDHLPGSCSCSCSNGTLCDNTTVNTDVGQIVCGLGEKTWRCNPDLTWFYLGGDCSCSGTSCPSGILCDGAPVTGNVGQVVCGGMNREYKCHESGWVLLPSGCSCTMGAIGSLDAANCSQAAGWACDPDNVNQALDVNIYADGTLIGTAHADLLREVEVGNLCGTNRNHGFVFTMPASLRDGSDHTIRAYAVGIGPSPGAPVYLAHSTPPEPATTGVCDPLATSCPGVVLCNLVSASPAVGATVCAQGSVDSLCTTSGMVPTGSGCTCNASGFLTQTVPATMDAGQIYSVTVKLQNTGSATWDYPLTCYNGVNCSYRLGSQNPTLNMTWGKNLVSVPAAVPPGQPATFVFTVTAPTTPGTYNFQWQMVEENVAWFGPQTPNVSVAVVGANCTATCAANSDCASGYCETSVSPHKCWAHAGTNCNCNGSTLCDGTSCSIPAACTGYCCAAPGPSAVCCTGGYTCDSGGANSCNIVLPYPCTP